MQWPLLYNLIIWIWRPARIISLNSFKYWLSQTSLKFITVTELRPTAMHKVRRSPSPSSDWDSGGKTPGVSSRTGWTWQRISNMCWPYFRNRQEIKQTYEGIGAGIKHWKGEVLRLWKLQIFNLQGIELRTVNGQRSQQAIHLKWILAWTLAFVDIWAIPAFE